MTFDLAVLGTEPTGLEAARLASEAGLRVAVVSLPFPRVLQTGKPSPPSALRADSPTVRHFNGSVSFVTSEQMIITDSTGSTPIESRRILLACGTTSRRPKHVPFDGERVLDGIEALSWSGSLPPQSVALIVGAGEQGLRCTAHFLAQGLRVVLVDSQSSPNLMELSIGERKLLARLRAPEGVVRWGTTVIGAESRKDYVLVFFDDGSIETCDLVVFAVGRVGRTESLQLPRSDLLLDESGRVWCGPCGQTGVPHVYAVGSVVGFPRITRPALEEATLMIRHAFGDGQGSGSRVKSPEPEKTASHGGRL